jgi:hypothetical protein
MIGTLIETNDRMVEALELYDKEVSLIFFSTLIPSL